MSFLGIRLPNEITRLLSEVEIPGEKTPRDHMHVTIGYLGKKVPVENLAQAIVAIYKVTSLTQPFTLRTNMVTTFSPNPDDGVPIIARVESNELHSFRDAVLASLVSHKVPFNNKYPEYKPHVTLGYSQDPLVDADKAADKEIPSVEWGVGEIVLWGGDTGDDRLNVTFPLSLGKVASDWRRDAYQAIIRLSQAVKLAHNPDGTCPDECPCHGEKTAQRVVDRYKAALGVL